jgi:SAM-dependent MidA family methyltransferase
VAERLSEAMRRSLYGPGGFFVRDRPADHFRTSVTASPLFAQAIATLVARADRALGHPDRLTVADIGAGGGELLTRLLALLTPNDRIDAIAVELAPRPDGLDPRIEWRHEMPERFAGVLLAMEWLDNVPLDRAELGDDEVMRYPETGEILDDADRVWVDEWWPLTERGQIAEIGRTRDEAWREAVSRLDRGVALAVDYGHRRHDRRPTLTGYLHGRQVHPRFDGSSDITAHVAIDSVAASAAFGVHLVKQRDALRALGIDGARPPLDLASQDPGRYVRELARASQAADLTGSAGLGDHWWLLETVDLEWAHGDFRGTGRAEHRGAA